MIRIKMLFLGVWMLSVVIALSASSALADTLDKLWVYPINSSICEDEFVHVSSDGNYVVAVSERTKLYMFDAQGNLKWNYIAPRKTEFSNYGHYWTGDNRRLLTNLCYHQFQLQWWLFNYIRR